MAAAENGTSAGSLHGLVALITGGSRRIGLAVARELALAGADIAINYSSDTAQADAAAAEIVALGRRAIAVQADVRDAAAVGSMIERIERELGGLDILVNNAARRPHSTLADISIEDWHAVVDLVLDGSFLCAKLADGLLARSGRGAIVNMGGLFALIGGAETPHVSAAKMGLIGVTRSLAQHFGPKGVTVNCVVPGSIGASDDPPERATRHQPIERIPMRRIGTPEDIARAVRALVGPDFRYVTGQTIHVNGGLYAG